MAQSRKTRGVSALATVLTAISVFGILTASVGQLAMERLRGTSRSNLQLRAKYATNYGMERVLQYLDTHISYTNPTNTLAIAPIDGNDFHTNHTNVTLAHDTDTRYSARIHSNLGGTGTIVAPDGTPIAPGQIYLEMVGQVGETVGRVNTRHSGSMGHIGIQEFPYAILADGKVTMVNSSVRTYASRLLNNFGPLPPQYTFDNPTAVGQFATVGRIASNARVGAINLDNSTVNGTLSFGAGGSSATALNVTATASPNTATPLAQPIFITKYKPPVSPESVTTVHTLTGAGNQLVLTPGDYYRSLTVTNGAELVLKATQPGTNTFYFSESLQLDHARLRIELDTPKSQDCRIKLYIGDRLEVNNSEINSEAALNAPPNHDARTYSYSLNIFGVGRGGPLSQSQFIFNNSKVYALLAGSRTNLDVSNNSEIYGAIKVRTVSFVNSILNYDASVNHADVRKTLWGLVSWTLQGVSDYNGADLFVDLGAGAAAAPGDAAAAAGAGALADAAAAGATDAVTTTGPAVGDAAVVTNAATGQDAAADPDAAAPADAAATDAAATDAAATDAAATDAAATDAAATDAAVADAAATDAAATDAAATDAAAATGDAAYDAAYDAALYGCPGPNYHCP